MKSASIRSVQHGLAAMIAEVEQGEEIIITRRNHPVARLSPITPAVVASAAETPATLRDYWRQRPLPPAVRSTLTHADLVAEGRGDL
ncbi:MAG: type II toxin-antitoxin system prevent-host-death family antitoxin [Verrucomicrobia bacterium]|nr:type II toxin-antitoxin system prevent-host-death family antitoxin [Verrucomicrobiota bacterium]